MASVPIRKPIRKPRTLRVAERRTKKPARKPKLEIVGNPNIVVMSEEEFAFRKKNNDPFVWRFLKQPKIMLFGLEEELLK